MIRMNYSSLNNILLLKRVPVLLKLQISSGLDHLIHAVTAVELINILSLNST